MPGNAAPDALALAGEMFPEMRTQTLIDKPVITGLCALHWKALALYGDDRERWKLPDTLKLRGAL